MQVHVKRFGAILVTLVFICSCLSSRHAVAYSPARYQVQQQEPHRARTQMFTPPTALVAPSASVPAAQEAQQHLHIAGDAVLHHVPASHVENAHLHEAIPSMSTDSIDSEVDKVAEAAVTGATIAGAAAIARAAVGSAAATAGAAAATRAAAAYPYVDAVDDWEDLADVLHLLNLESEHAEDHTLPGSDHGVAENITTFPPGGHGNPEYHIVPQSSDVASSANASPSYASLLTRSVQRGSDEGVVASLHPSLTRRMLPGKGVTISRSPALRHVLPTAFISGKALEPFVFEELTKEDDCNGRAGSADSPTVSASKTPESASSELPSTSATSNAMWRKPESAAWLCRISQPYKGCNTRLYYPGMKDRVSDGDVSAGKFYNGATCPEGFCCSKTACSSVGCGDTCSDSSVLCLFQHVEKSYGRGCSCADQPAPRCHPLATCHESLVPGGGVWCECPEGYKGNGLVCCKVGSTGAGCDDTLRRPGVQPASRGNGSNLTVQWTTVWLSVATWALFGHL